MISYIYFFFCGCMAESCWDPGSYAEPCFCPFGRNNMGGLMAPYCDNSVVKQRGKIADSHCGLKKKRRAFNMCPEKSRGTQWNGLKASIPFNPESTCPNKKHVNYCKTCLNPHFVGFWQFSLYIVATHDS